MLSACWALPLAALNFYFQNCSSPFLTWANTPIINWGHLYINIVFKSKLRTRSLEMWSTGFGTTLEGVYQIKNKSLHWNQMFSPKTFQKLELGLEILLES
jgi:hypothetical protein